MRPLTRRAALIALSAPWLTSPASADIPRIFRVPGPSMEPTIMEGEYVFTMPVLHFSEVGRGDIVAFRQAERGETLIKRIIALSGDRVSFRGGRPTCNGVEAHWTPQESRGPLQTFRETLSGRSYLVELVVTSRSVIRDVAETIVPAGQVYVVADSRDRSFDSRVPVFGPVALREVSHKAVSIRQSDDPTREGRTLE